MEHVDKIEELCTIWGMTIFVHFGLRYSLETFPKIAI